MCKLDRHFKFANEFEPNPYLESTIPKTTFQDPIRFSLHSNKHIHYIDLLYNVKFETNTLSLYYVYTVVLEITDVCSTPKL